MERQPVVFQMLLNYNCQHLLLMVMLPQEFCKIWSATGCLSFLPPFFVKQVWRRALLKGSPKQSTFSKQLLKIKYYWQTDVTYGKQEDKRDKWKTQPWWLNTTVSWGPLHNSKSLENPWQHFNSCFWDKQQCFYHHSYHIW